MSQLVLPHWVVSLCGLCALISILISIVGIHLQFKNYRKPIQQRLIVRIQIMVPLYAISCYVSLRWFSVSMFIEPIKEIYEAFVIYTFFSLLTHLLGGERNIVVITSGRPPVDHPPPFKKIFPPVDISDPFSLLAIKRGILQYVWLKPIICGLTAVTEAFGLQDFGYGMFNMYFFINFVYNLSVSISLYELALFWKCLYGDLKQFNPWGKFLCVKLIIFASYWQGIILGILSWFGILKNENSDSQNTLGFAIQNALLCVELIGFAIGHWYSFSWTEYSAETLSGCGRLTYLAAIKDTFGFGDLVYDFQSTFSGDLYDYRNFDSVEALIAHPSSRSRMARFNEGLRFTDAGKQKYWLPNTHSTKINGSNNSSQILTNPGNASMINSPHIKTPLIPKKQRSHSITSSHASTRAVYANSVLTVDSKEDTPSIIGITSPVNVNVPVMNYSSINDESLSDDDTSLANEYLYDDDIYESAKRERPYGDKNCPVVYDKEAYTYSPAIQRLRQEAMRRQSCV